MGKIVETTISNFSGGMTGDPRGALTKSQRIEHFDALTFPHKLIPFRSYINADSSSSTNQIAAFDYYKGALYGLGIHSGIASSGIFQASTPSGTPSWSEISTFGGAGASRTNADLPFFKGYKGKLFGVRGGRYVWAFDLIANTFDTSNLDLTAYSTVSNGLVHSKDDCLYLGYDNNIARNNNLTWDSTPVLTLPDKYKITALCEYGDYLAIACTTTDVDQQSVVFLWDRDSSLTTIAASIDWGSGSLIILEQIDGVLVGVSQVNSDFNANGRLVFKSYSGGTTGAERFEELAYSAAGLQNFQQKVNNRLLFSGAVTQNSTTTRGIYSVGRPAPSSPFAVTFERLIVNDITVVNVSSAQGFIVLGDTLFLSYFDGGTSQYAMVKSDPSANYTAVSVYESNIINSGAPRQKKRVCGVAVFFEALPSGASVTLKYKKEGDSSWTTVFTFSTEGEASHATSVIESTGLALPQHREYESRVESTGGAVLTGVQLTAEIMDDKY